MESRRIVYILLKDFKFLIFQSFCIQLEYLSGKIFYSSGSSSFHSRKPLHTLLISILRLQIVAALFSFFWTLSHFKIYICWVEDALIFSIYLRTLYYNLESLGAIVVSDFLTQSQETRLCITPNLENFNVSAKQ